MLFLSGNTGGKKGKKYYYHHHLESSGEGGLPCDESSLFSKQKHGDYIYWEDIPEK